MFDVLQLKKEAIGAINSALTILEEHPEYNDGNTSLSINRTLNPFDFIQDLFKNTISYTKFLEAIGEFCYVAMPALDVIVKTILISNLKMIFSCDVNPFITTRVLRDGLTVDLRTLDVLNMLSYSPLKSNKNGVINPGSYYYFGCDNYDCVDELSDSVDFNAFLWYAKNRPHERHVWREAPVDALKKHTFKKRKIYPSENRKQTRKDGVLTLEYVGNPQNLTDAEGNQMYVQTPTNSCLHIFIGNTKEIEDNSFIYELRENIIKESKIISKYEKLSNDIDSYLNEIFEFKNSLIKENETDSDVKKWLFENATYDEKLLMSIRDTLKKQNKISDYFDSFGYKKIPFAPNDYIFDDSNTFTSISQKPQNVNPDFIKIVNGGTTTYYTYRACIASLSKYATKFEKSIDNAEYTLSCFYDKKLVIPLECFFSTLKLEQNKKELYERQIETQNISNHYRDVKKNYYYHKPLMLFNIDYIMSLRIFDAKVLMAQIIDSITNAFSFNVNLSWQESIIKKEVGQMVNSVLETDEAVVNDCFFTFSNEKYNDMLKQTELERQGLMTDEKGISNNKEIDSKEIARLLDGLTDEATEQEVLHTVKTTLSNVCDYLSKTETSTEGGFDINFQYSIIERLLMEIANRLVMAFVTPKIYLIMVINMMIMGEDPSFDLTKFIASHKDILVKIIRAVRDEILSFFVNKLMSWFNEIVNSLTLKLNTEQIEYYIKLLRSCIDCIKTSIRKNEDFNLDNVNYADIYDEISTPKENKC